MKQQFTPINVWMSGVLYQRYGNTATVANKNKQQTSSVNFKSKNILMDYSMAKGNYNVAALKIKSPKDALNEIPRSLRKIFNDLKDLKGDSFVNEAYRKMKSYLKLDGIAPEKIEKSGPDKLNKYGERTIIEGGYNPRFNSIVYSDGFFNKLQKFEQINFISHELKHAEQASKIIRSGFISQYAGTWAKFQVSDILQDPLNNVAQSALKKARENGTLKEFITGAMKACKEQTLNDMNNGHSGTIKSPKYNEGTIEYKKGERYLNSYKSYSNDIYSDEYKNNPIELEAYAFGTKMEKYFKIHELSNNSL